MVVSPQDLGARGPRDGEVEKRPILPARSCGKAHMALLGYLTWRKGRLDGIEGKTAPARCRQRPLFIFAEPIDHREALAKEKKRGVSRLNIHETDFFISIKIRSVIRAHFHRLLHHARGNSACYAKEVWQWARRQVSRGWLRLSIQLAVPIYRVASWQAP